MPLPRAMTPQSEVAYYLAQIGDRVQEEYSSQLCETTGRILELPRPQVTYCVFQQIAEELISASSGWTRVRHFLNSLSQGCGQIHILNSNTNMLLFQISIQIQLQISNLTQIHCHFLFKYIAGFFNLIQVLFRYVACVSIIGQVYHSAWNFVFGLIDCCRQFYKTVLICTTVPTSG